MSSAPFVDIPAQWQRVARPFFQRAEEFEGKEPAVSYFLRTHVAYICMKKRSKGNPEETQYLKSLLDALEKLRQQLGSVVDGVDGRTVLTKYALMLFSRADDSEREGQANLVIVKQFFAAAILFEATEQFTSDGKMDAFAADKCKYAIYTAAQMKKALDAGVPYVSPNVKEGGITIGGSGEATINMGVVPTTPTFTNPPAPPATPPLPFVHPPAATVPATEPQTYSSPHFTMPVAPPPAYSSAVAQRGDNYTTTMMPAVPSHSAGVSGMGASAVPTTNPMTPPLPSGTRGTPSAESMIDAQNHARQAVSALQFYDHAYARNELIAALRLLSGE